MVTVISGTTKNPPRISVQMDKETQKRLRKYTVDKRLDPFPLLNLSG